MNDNSAHASTQADDRSSMSLWLDRIALVLAWIFGGVFIWAGWVKVQDPSQFLVSIRSFHLLPDPFAAWLALLLPWLEIFSGLCVFTGWLRRGGLLLLNASLVVFAIALVTAWARGLDVECGCFGGGKGTTTIVEALIRDAVLLAVGAWLMLRRK
ncbi:MAG: MauE/DoxX family redox-associated membrane protein [Roseimicrobium sp.]